MKTREEVYCFMNDNDIDHQIPWEFDIEKDYYAKGVIRAKDLEHGKYYIGKCRNNHIGRWNAETKEMWYQNFGFGNYYPDKVNYLDDDNGYDLFIALKEIDEEEVPEQYRVEITEG